jgi:uncharacterized membrane protein YgcG
VGSVQITAWGVPRGLTARLRDACSELPGGVSLRAVADPSEVGAPAVAGGLVVIGTRVFGPDGRVITDRLSGFSGALLYGRFDRVSMHDEVMPLVRSGLVSSCISAGIDDQPIDRLAERIAQHSSRLLLVGFYERLERVHGWKAALLVRASVELAPKATVSAVAAKVGVAPPDVEAVAAGGICAFAEGRGEVGEPGREGSGGEDFGGGGESKRWWRRWRRRCWVGRGDWSRRASAGRRVSCPVLGADVRFSAVRSFDSSSIFRCVSAA